MWTYVYREVLESFRYRVIWLNLFITPFFTFAPFVYLVNQNAREDVLIGLLCWYELNQLFFGISNCLIEERMNGTFINLFIMPFSFSLYLLAKGIWLLLQTISIILFTILLFAFFGIYISHMAYVFALLVINGIFVYGVSVLYLSFVIRFRRLGKLNAIVQQALGFFSGYTNDIQRFPSYVRVISFLLPLTYMIMLARDMQSFSLVYLCMAGFLSFLCYIVGEYMIKKQWHVLRQKGDMDLW